ncbi:MAG: ComEA family DNA-binding protein, partial [Candidatus Hydrogenedentes bacterium]|nr:ComEA family DNA-binding protein [Candidatus Hydrogenedentota bacterium]
PVSNSYTPGEVTAPQTIDEPTKRLRVSVAGAVTSPGVYEFDTGDRVSDAVRAAGGVLEYADVSDINQAATLVDSSTLAIPHSGRAAIEDGNRMVLRAGESAALINPKEYTISGWAGRKPVQTSTATSPSVPDAAPDATKSDGPIDLNSATVEELETLPGVGPKTAIAIIQYREKQPFQTIEDLDNVPGIGEKKLEDLRPHVRVGGQ